jgi:hypothetical protein
MSKRVSAKKPIGRPSVYRAEFAERAREMCFDGATDADLALEFRVHVDTINAWQHRHPAFREALKAKSVADGKVVASLFERATGYSHKAVKIFVNPSTGKETIVEYTEHHAPDTTACIFWLKNRQRNQWRDKQDVEHSGPGGGPIPVDVNDVRARIASRITGIASRMEAREDPPDVHENGARGS